jgi:hypothetical protein
MMRRWGCLVVLGGVACGSGGRFHDEDFGDASVGFATSPDGEGGSGFDDRPVDRSGKAPPPISGGTMIVLDDGNTVVASDPDRDVVHVATLSDLRSIATIELEPGDEPGRLVADDEGLVHVALRRGAALVSISTSDWTIAARTSTCANPRGVAFDDDRGLVLVACAGGELVAHAPGGAIAERNLVAPDLRDVIVHEGAVQVSRFRTAEVLAVDEHGDVLSAVVPTSMSRAREAGVAWHTSPTPDGGWMMIHQSAAMEPIDLEPPSGGSSYGGPSGGGPSSDGCDGPVAAVLSIGAPDGTIKSTEALTFTTLAVDAAMSPDGRRIAIAVAGQHDDESPTMRRQRGLVLVNTAMLAEAPDADCHDPEDLPLPGHVIAVKYASDGVVVAQSREPAELYVVDVDARTFERIELQGESVQDTGHDLFHQDAGVGLACASCHPEGGDDGRVWLFDPGTAKRRTQSLRAAIADTEPFHWEGDLDDFAMLAGEVHTHRMGAALQSDERTGAFADYVFAIPPTNPERSAEDALVVRGAEVFVAAGCDSCHSDYELSAGKTAEIRGEKLQVPPLRGIALRPPYMHDGRSADLEEAVLDMIATTAPDTALTPDDLVAMLAYLESL